METQDILQIETYPLYYHEAYICINTWPTVYTYCISELRRCVKEYTFLSMFKETPDIVNIYNVSTFDVIKNYIAKTPTNLVYTQDYITLNINKCIFDSQSVVKKSLLHLGWTKQNLDTLRDKRILEFEELRQVFNCEKNSIKTQLEETPLIQDGLSPSQEDIYLAEANKKRVFGILNIINQIEKIYDEGYKLFINDITEQLHTNHTDPGEERFYTRIKTVEEIIRNIPKVSINTFMQSSLPGDIIVSYPKKDLLTFGRNISYLINSSVQGSSFSSIKVVGSGSTPPKEVIGYGVKINTSHLDKIKFKEFMNTVSGAVLLKHKSIRQQQRTEIIKIINQHYKNHIPYSTEQIIKSSIAHIFKKSIPPTKKSIVATALICSTIIQVIYKQVGLQTNIDQYSDLEVWPIDFLQSDQFEKVCAYFAENEYTEN